MRTWERSVPFGLLALYFSFHLFPMLMSAHVQANILLFLNNRCQSGRRSWCLEKFKKVKKEVWMAYMGKVTQTEDLQA
jgi:hypothetical protein